ncbi:Glycosyl transferase family 2 [Candidatus Methylomirabilis lanthanidiphila]|uniref:Glycosyl transferase family 2 n=1 Tax=Candidatus Methylomirabilis lanthanidiphila TaxID=2211376 RepID=A0A564ZF81_9BACT|nr:glycosyltransferase family 2 protein [Candidatus Methylomirabilis lanthanidiphila]VUZ83934.1 Glycosyl transferase family 2 [Candidatus Methylomirabilis lanthanidiphila]
MVDRSGTERPQHGSTPRVAILILNWNGMRDTLETLESVHRLHYGNFEVVLVDNGSTDDSCNAIASAFPTVRLIASPANLGVAGGRNLGIEAILQESDIDYVLFLDNDVTLESSLLDKLVAAAEGDVALGIVGPIVCYHSDPQRIWSAGSRFIFREVISRLRLTNHLVTQELTEGLEYVDALPGCCMLVTRRVFETIGCFNPLYFMACDDSEFCYRAAKAGFRRGVVTQALLWHKVSTSTGGGYTPGRAYFTSRSTIVFLKAHGRLWHWASALTCAALSLPLAYLRERRRGNQHAVTMKFKGYLDGLLGRPIDPEVEQYFQRGQSGPADGAHIRRNA